MKPTILTVQAFGPYAGRQRFDFRELGDRRLFLIHGPTGSGKTSVLDAMCYALFGACSGDDRETSRLRSDHAEADTRTEVTFDFAIGDAHYRAFRSPDWERPKRKGSGTIKEGLKATLWRRTDCGEEGEEGTVLASKWERVTKEIENLLGLAKDQFRQVVVLPQGQFRRLLTSKTDDREEILKVLFQSQRFEAIARALRDEHKALEGSWRGKQSEREGVLRTHEVGALEELRVRATELEAHLEALVPRVVEAQRMDTVLQETLERARITVGQLQERDDAEAVLAVRRLELDAMAAVRLELASARFAAPLLPLLDDADERRRAATEAKSELVAATDVLAYAAEARADAERERDEARARAPERDAAVQRLAVLASIISAMDELQQAIDAVAVCTERTQQSQNDSELARFGWEAHKEEESELIAELEEVRPLAATLESRQQELERLRELGRARLDLEKVGDDELRLLELEAGAREGVARAETSLAVGRERCDRLEQASRLGRAAALARSLSAGQPCLVCGSLDHPAPAEDSDGVPSDEMLDDARASLEEQRALLSKKQKALADVERELSTVREKMNSLRERLGPMATEALTDVNAKIAEAEGACSSARSARDRLAEIQDALPGVREAVSEAERQLEGLVAAHTEAQRDQQSAQVRMTEREGKVPSAYRDPGVANTEQQELERTTAEIAEKIRKAEEAAIQASSAEQGAVSAHKVREEAYHGAEAAAATAASRVAEALAKSPFADIEGVRSAARSNAECTALQERVQEAESAFKSSDDRFQRAVEAAKGLTMPDIATLEQARHEAQETARALVEERERMRSESAAARRGIATLEGLDAEAQGIEEEQRVIGALSDAASGKNPRALSLQRYVLATRLDEVLILATARLRQMSHGRYDLQRIDEVVDRRAKAGLDLEVFDAYTGKARPTGNLSGGESFLAALALSLGLTDVVQAHAGGVQLDTLFIDEGFGTLDPEALELAMATLVELQKGGRLVGVISHVPELRERIDARLEVQVGNRGSRAQFKVG